MRAWLVVKTLPVGPAFRQGQIEAFGLARSAMVGWSSGLAKYREAETARVDVIKTLLNAKPAPKNALRFISDSMGGHSYTVADGLSKHHGFAAELLGGSDNYGELV